jgi:hypothetical protein
VLAREPLSIDDCALYPLFDDELLALMRSVIAPDKQHAVGVAVIFRARRGNTALKQSTAGARLPGRRGGRALPK